MSMSSPTLIFYLAMQVKLLLLLLVYHITNIQFEENTIQLNSTQLNPIRINSIWKVERLVTFLCFLFFSLLKIQFAYATIQYTRSWSIGKNQGGSFVPRWEACPCRPLDLIGIKSKWSNWIWMELEGWTREKGNWIELRLNWTKEKFMRNKEKKFSGSLVQGEAKFR